MSWAIVSLLTDRRSLPPPWAIQHACPAPRIPGPRLAFPAGTERPRRSSRGPAPSPGPGAIGSGAPRLLRDRRTASRTKGAAAPLGSGSVHAERLEEGGICRKENDKRETGAWRLGVWRAPPQPRVVTCPGASAPPCPRG